MAASFSLAAARVLERYDRRFGYEAGRCDLTTIKSRWYARKIAHVKRETLGKQKEKEVA